MTVTECGTYTRREYAEREILSAMADAPEGVTFVLRINDSALWVVEEHDSTDGAAWAMAL